MLIFENRAGLNEVFTTVIKKSIGDYVHTKGEYSVSELSRNPDSVILLRRCLVDNEFDLHVDYLNFFNTLQGHFADKYVKDAVEESQILLPSYSGKGRPKKSDYNFGNIEIGKKRIVVHIEDLGVSLSGAFDYIVDKFCVQDLKNISRRTYLDHLTKYHEQLNCYAYLLRRKGRKVTCLNLDIIIKDPKLHDSDIPFPIFTMPIPLWDYNVTEKFIYGKLKTLLQHEKLSTNELIEIAKKNRFQETITSWAVKRDGNRINTKVVKVRNNDENAAYLEAVKDCEARGGSINGYHVNPVVETKESIDYSLLYSILD